MDVLRNSIIAAFAAVVFLVALLSLPLIVTVTVAFLGLLPAAIAASKGRDFFMWWLYGSALFIIALPHAIVVGPAGGKRACPHCAESVKVEAKVCPHCQRDLPNPAVTPATAST